MSMAGQISIATSHCRWVSSFQPSSAAANPARTLRRNASASIHARGVTPRAAHAAAACDFPAPEGPVIKTVVDTCPATSPSCGYFSDRSMTDSNRRRIRICPACRASSLRDGRPPLQLLKPSWDAITGTALRNAGLGWRSRPGQVSVPGQDYTTSLGLLRVASRCRLDKHDVLVVVDDVVDAPAAGDLDLPLLKTGIGGERPLQLMMAT